MHPVARAQDASLSATVGYDALAAEYDEQVRGDEWMRRALHARYRRAFRAGHRVLDVGCGTGIDAVALGRLGVRVLAVDGSPAMIGRLIEKIDSERLQGMIEGRVLQIQDLRSVADERFDGLIAGFASLSTLPSLAGFAVDAARLVRPGGRAVLHLLNRFSAWEWLGCLRRGDLTAARRIGRQRVREFVIGGQSVPHTLYFAHEAYRFFAREFGLRAAFSLGAVRPPHTVRRLPATMVRALEWLDVRTGRWPLLNDAGRFFVLDLERRTA